ncbi:TIGR02391 family protein [bacterium]|nr:TIGR02391 family protein [bacterium]
MADYFEKFEIIVRKAKYFTDTPLLPSEGLHLFEERNIHPSLQNIAKRLFDDGHFAQATFEAFKFLDKEVQRHAKNKEFGVKLMMQVFNEKSPQIKLSALSSESECDEQEGYKFLFAGSVLAIRNPRGHEYIIKDTIDQCLDHLVLVSLLLRRLDDAGYHCKKI